MYLYVYVYIHMYIYVYTAYICAYLIDIHTYHMHI